jgi:hypothetical protein
VEFNSKWACAVPVGGVRKKREEIEIDPLVVVAWVQGFRV